MTGSVKVSSETITDLFKESFPAQQCGFPTLGVSLRPPPIENGCDARDEFRGCHCRARPGNPSIQEKSFKEMDARVEARA
jgi:hypothetical protein